MDNTCTRSVSIAVQSAQAPNVYVVAPEAKVLRVSQATPVVYVVDRDASVRESIELLICRSGWQPRACASAEEFLAHPRMLIASCLVVELSLSGLSGLELQTL